jgi:hypothetical protein
MKTARRALEGLIKPMSLARFLDAAQIGKPAKVIDMTGMRLCHYTFHDECGDVTVTLRLDSESNSSSSSGE